MNPKVDWKMLEREYVTTDVSARELARRHGLSNGTVSGKVKDLGWDRLRDEYRDKLSRRTYEKYADRNSDVSVEVQEELVKAARATVYKYVEGLKNGNVVPTPKDFVLSAELLMRLFGEPTERLEAKILGVNISASGRLEDPDFLRRLEQLTRGARDDAPPAPRLRLEGSGPH